MIKNFKYLIGLIITITFMSHSAFAAGVTDWESSGANFTADGTTTGFYGSNNQVSAQQAQSDVNLVVGEISTLRISTDTHHVDGTGVRSVDADPVHHVANKAHGQFYDVELAILEISNNNPLGFQIEITENGNDDKIPRRVFTPGGHSNTAAHSSSGQYDEGNSMEFHLSFQYLDLKTDIESKNYYLGTYTTESTTTHYHPPAMVANKTDGGGYDKLTNMHNYDGTNNKLILDFTHDATDTFIHHSTHEYPILVTLHYKWDDRLLRGLFKDTITFTLIDGY